MSTLDEVENAVRILESNGTGRENIILLHCTTQYPTPFGAVNLRAMDALATLGCASVGYSDHTQGIAVPVAAVALGASVIEKHFTLDRSLPGPDQTASLEPDELRQMVDEIRQVELAIGDGEKKVTEVERPNIEVARKSIVATKFIRKGDVLSEDNLTVKRPGSGVSPMLWDSVIGTVAVADFLPDQPIEI